MFSPGSGVEVNPLIAPLAALVVSTFTSMGGVSGAFLLLPFLVSSLNFTTPAVSPTNLGGKRHPLFPPAISGQSFSSPGRGQMVMNLAGRFRAGRQPFVAPAGPP
jgi:hypothetical protein